MPRLNGAGLPQRGRLYLFKYHILKSRFDDLTDWPLLDYSVAELERLGFQPFASWHEHQKPIGRRA
jgi:hypothetical protein